jgi:hypothetical protein
LLNLREIISTKRQCRAAQYLLNLLNLRENISTKRQCRAAQYLLNLLNLRENIPPSDNASSPVSAEFASIK